MKRIGYIILISAICYDLFLKNTAQADYVLWIPYQVLMEGEITVHPGGTLTLRSAFGNCRLPVKETIFWKIPSLQKRFQRLQLKNQGEGSENLLQVARWALKQGLLEEYYQMLERVLEQNAQHRLAGNLLRKRQQLTGQLKEPSSEIEELQKIIGHKMKVRRSPHFILLHDTEDQTVERRIQLLETFYESFLMFFWSQGYPLQEPALRLRVVLFDQFHDFQTFARKVRPGLENSAGFWDTRYNVTVFSKYGTQGHLKELLEAARKTKQQVAENTGERTRLRRVLRALNVAIATVEEKASVEVVFHEMTHQMAGSTGLLPRMVRIPDWVHEGLATFFESPADAGWSAIGAVNKTRLNRYRQLANHVDPIQRKYSSVDFVMTNQIFLTASTPLDQSLAYGQSWALTHFLINRYFDSLMEYYEILSKLPPDTLLHEERLRACFNKVFENGKGELDSQWRAYMQRLTTDLDRLLKENKNH